MTDIFVSYKREDRARINPLILALEDCGYKVWSDARSRISTKFIIELNERLEEAKCVLVIWSRLSVSSTWVLDESYRGYVKGNLVPLRIDDVHIPVPFYGMQTADFRKWGGDQHSDCWKDLRDAINETIASAPMLHGAQPADEPDEILHDDVISKSEIREGPNGSVSADTRNEIRREIASILIAILRDSGGRVNSAKAAQAIKGRYPKHIGQFDWLGHSSFKEFIEDLALPSVSFNKTPPGYLVLCGSSDDEGPAQSKHRERDADIDQFLSKVMELAEIPLLESDEYRMVFKGISQSLNRGHASMAAIVKDVRDSLPRRNLRISRPKIEFILKGCLYSGLKFDMQDPSFEAVGRYFANSVYYRCGSRGWDFTPSDNDLLLTVLGLPRS